MKSGSARVWWRGRGGARARRRVFRGGTRGPLCRRVRVVVAGWNTLPPFSWKRARGGHSYLPRWFSVPVRSGFLLFFGVVSIGTGFFSLWKMIARPTARPKYASLLVVGCFDSALSFSGVLACYGELNLSFRRRPRGEGESWFCLAVDVFPLRWLAVPFSGGLAWYAGPVCGRRGW